MADNFDVTPGTGKTIRSKQKTSGAYCQMVTIDLGSGTTENQIVAGQGTMANSVPVAIASDQPQATLNTLADATRAVQVNLVPHSAGGSTPYLNLDLDETGVVVKASAGQIYDYYISNLHTTDVRYVKVYDKASAATSSDTPKKVLTLQPKACANLSLAVPWQHTLGISLRATTGFATADTGAPGTNDVIVNFGYK